MSMLALPESYRFCIFNQTGITISDAPIGLPTISGRRVRLDSSGATSYEAAVFTFFSMTGTIANNGYTTGSTLSNTASGWLGGEFLVSVFASGNASGNVTVYLEASPDGGTTWPVAASANGAGGGTIVAIVGFGSTTTISTASTTRRRLFEL